MDESNANPLGQDPKREKSGSDTFRKYNYQYHWAFCRMLDEHEKGNEFALFIEEHEDVTIASSLDVDKTTFEFNQVKETSKTYTVDNLTKKSKKEPKSIIEKLAISCCDKSYTDKITRVNFVSTGGYSFDINKKGYTFEVINSGQLSKEEEKKITDCIAHIKDTSEFFEKLAFIIPDLPDKGFDHVVEGRISSLISKLVPGLNYNSNSIYACIIRDLSRKGENKFDYQNWDEALRKKAITHKQLTEVIEQHISRKPDENIANELTFILTNDYSLNSIERRKVRNAFDRYYTKRAANREPLIKSVSDDLIININNIIESCSSAKDLEAKVITNLNEKTLLFFSSSEDFTGAFLYEFLANVKI
ncbi:DUF4297 domain-containing protein [Methylomonas sp. MV1]|uniref:DUF4297 domain-containing protein n=1 Tax=Methylomonas sp. MV1 TaxID=3073620 RepID=UPI0028A4754C|nr:DUF4297 domain-containing protein [Methylomonas sp. MV1]MDT4331901.1 DUF4297 domain-containing protein [Methylomonas sp. MV1]